MSETRGEEVQWCSTNYKKSKCCRSKKKKKALVISVTAAKTRVRVFIFLVNIVPIASLVSALDITRSDLTSVVATAVHEHRLLSHPVVLLLAVPSVTAIYDVVHGRLCVAFHVYVLIFVVVTRGRHCWVTLENNVGVLTI